MRSDIVDLSQTLGRLLASKSYKIGSAESCTGGLLAAAITEVAGSSQWFDEGLVTYSDFSKHRLLGVAENLIGTHGAVSQEVVDAMVDGVKNHGADCAVAISGIAGPAGGTPDKPVGTVWLAWAVPGFRWSKKVNLPGERCNVREQAVFVALSELVSVLQSD